MQVNLKYPWFSPSVSRRLNEIQARSGRYYTRGVHFLPDELFSYLPTSATILVAPEVMPDLEGGTGPVLEVGEEEPPEGHDISDLPPRLRAHAKVLKEENETAGKAKKSVEEERLSDEKAEIDRKARRANHKRKRAAKAEADEKAAASRDTKESAK